MQGGADLCREMSVSFPCSGCIWLQLGLRPAFTFNLSIIYCSVLIPVQLETKNSFARSRRVFIIASCWVLLFLGCVETEQTSMCESKVALNFLLQCWTVWVQKSSRIWCLCSVPSREEAPTCCAVRGSHPDMLSSFSLPSSPCWPSFHDSCPEPALTPQQELAFLQRVRNPVSGTYDMCQINQYFFLLLSN